MDESELKNEIERLKSLVHINKKRTRDQENKKESWKEVADQLFDSIENPDNLSGAVRLYKSLRGDEDFHIRTKFWKKQYEIANSELEKLKRESSRGGK